MNASNETLDELLLSLQALKLQVNLTTQKANARINLVFNFLDQNNHKSIAPCKGIRIPESTNFVLVESGILGFGIQNPALRIRNPTKDWNPESNLLKIHSRLN